MPSKANAPRKSGHTKQFGKDWKRLERSGRYPMQELQHVMQLLIQGRAPLPPEYVDHPLKGQLADVLVTGDGDLLVLKDRYAIETPADFAKRL